MGMKKLDVEISDALYERFYQEVTKPGGLWRRGDYKRETARSAFRSAIETALAEFLDSRKKNWPDNSVAKYRG
jgi:hypothetical protein